MIARLMQLALHNSPGFIAMALVICLIGFWLLVGLLRRARRTGGHARAGWTVSAAIVAGVTVWTTHFLAMLGYRADLALNYNLGLTLLSAVIGILAIGLPLAATVLFSRVDVRVALGALAGLGIGAMHFTGMSAIQGCVQTQSWLAAILGGLAGAACFGSAVALTGRFHTRAVKTCLFTTGVVATHFIALSGVTLEPLPGFVAPAHLDIVLSLLTAGAAVTLFVGAAVSLVAAERFLIQEHAHTTILATALDNMSNGLIFIQRDERLRLFNDRFLHLFNVPPDTVQVGMPMAELIGVLARCNGWDSVEHARIARRMQERMQLTALETVEYRFADGRVIEIVSGPVEGGIVLTFDDMTAERRAQGQISYLAYHDPLTGLANRRALQDRMEEGFAPKRRYKLMLVDLDRFKAVNDTFGHNMGDKLLIEVASRLRAVMGKDGFVARMGGDEMAVLVYGDLDLSMAVAREIVAAIERPFEIDDVPLAIGCSVGMCCTDDAQDVSELIQRADLALYEAKRNGRGRASCYQAGMLEAVAERHQLEGDIQTAIQERQFHLEFQPVLSLESDTIVGYEALIRWQHPTRGNVPPVAFIPLAEETGQIFAIGKWVLDEACRQAASWTDGRHVAVNISPAQFKSASLSAHIVAALDKSGLPAQRLEVELTETALVDDGLAIAHVLADLRTLGVKVAMDDFGTGYSSFTHLRDFPIDRIKIDRSFLMNAATDSHSLSVLKAITQLGRDMDVPTLAEGVETQAQLDLLRQLGCNAVQGYLIGRPARLPPQVPEAPALRKAS